VARRSTGTVRLLKNDAGELQWHAKWTRADGTRTDWIAIDPKIALDDLAGAKACAARMAARVRKASETGSTIETVSDYAERWLAERVGRINSIRDDRSRMKHHILPTLGTLDVGSFTRDDVERLRDELDRKILDRELAWKTVASVWALVTSMCSDMVTAKKRQFRVRDDNPCRDVKPPERGSRKAKQYLFPSEFLAFVSCENVPLHWRRAVALAIYTYTRDGELRVLRWDHGDLDIEHGILSITRAYNRNLRKVETTKSGETRRFAVERNLLPLLRAMHAEKRGQGLVIQLMRERSMAERLRKWLLRAGVTRPELHEGSPTRKPMTWHDLRATGITWMAVRGDDPLKIKQRAGHSTFSTTEGYIREAEAIRDGFGEPFPSLPRCLLGIAPNRPGAISVHEISQKQAVFGGEGGIRTRGGLLTRARLASGYLRPLGHLS